MADSVFEIGIAVSGEDSGARAFENLKLREMEAKQEAAKLAAELRKLQQSGQATDEQIESAARAMIRAKQQAAGYAAEARNVQRAQQQTSRSVQASTQSVNEHAAAAHLAAQRVAAIGQSLGSLGSFVSQTDPELASFGRTLGTVASAAGAGGAAFGPWGAAIGAAAGVAATFVSRLDQITVSADEARAAIAHLGEEVARTNQEQQRLAGMTTAEDLSEGIDDARNQLRGLNAEIERRNDIIREQARIAGGSFEENVRALREEVGVHGEAADAVRGVADAQREVERISLEQLHTLRDQKQAETEIMESAQRRASAYAEQNDYLNTQSRFYQSILGDEERLRRMHREGVAARQRAEREREEASRRGAARARERQREEDAEFRGVVGGLTDFSGADEAQIRADIEAEAAQEIIDVRRQLAQWSAELTNETLDRDIAAIDRRLAKEREAAEEIARKKREEAERAAERERELAQITGQMWDQIGGSVLDAAGEMFKFVIGGAEGGADAFLAMLDSFLEATAVQYTIKALAEGAEAIAAAARYDFAAAGQHAAAAALAAGVAAATGLASAAIPNAPTSSGGGSPPAQLPAGASAQAGGTTQNVTVQVYTPNAVVTKAEQGALLAEAMRAARRELGPVRT